MRKRIFLMILVLFGNFNISSFSQWVVKLFTVFIFLFQDKRLVGTNGASLIMRVLVKVQIEDVTVAVFDRELLKPSSFIS